MRQGFATLSAPTKALEQAVLAQDAAARRRSGAALVLSGTSRSRRDAAGNLKPSKRVSTERIDRVVALVMALDRLQRNVVPPAAPDYQIVWLGAPP